MAHRDSAHFFVLGRETFLDKVFNTTTDTTPKKKKTNRCGQLITTTGTAATGNTIFFRLDDDDEKENVSPLLKVLAAKRMSFRFTVSLSLS